MVAIDAFTDYYSVARKRGNIAAAMEHPEFTLIEGSLLDIDLAPILDEVNLVFHLAAQPGVRTSWKDFDIYSSRNVGATQRLLHAAMGRPVEQVVLASSSSVYGDSETLPTRESATLRPVSPYGITKVATEHLARVYWRSFDVPTVCLRYFTVYGPRQRPDMAFNRVIRAALNEEPFKVFGDGNQTRDFTYVTDAVDGTIAAAVSAPPGAVYNIGGGSRRSMNSVFTTLGELLEVPVQLTFRDREPGDARHTAADISRAREDLGFEPSFEFADGLRLQLEWQRDAIVQRA